MALSKLLFSHTSFLRFPMLSVLPIVRGFCTLSPTAVAASSSPPGESAAAAERRRRKRQLRIQPPISHSRQNPRPPPSPRPISNPNAPKLPESPAVLVGNRLNLHNRILALIRADDLDEATLLTRHSIYSNCRPTTFTCDAVLSALLRRGRYADLLTLHRFVTQASVPPSVQTHNTLLQAFCDCRKTDAALDHFRLLLKDDSPVLPSPTTYRILARGLVDAGKLEQADELKNGMLERGIVTPDPQVYHFLMGGFVNTGQPDKAIDLFEELTGKIGEAPLTKGGYAYGNLMKAYFLKEMEDKAMSIHDEVLSEDSKVKFGAVGYNHVLDALGRNGKIEQAEHLFERMRKENDPPRWVAVNLGSFNVMIDAYCRIGRFSDAISVFGKIGEERCAPDTLSYNNLIDQLGNNKLITEAEVLYKEMGERGVIPDEYTHVLLVDSCFGVDKVDDAVTYFRKMFDAGLRPNANAYNKVMHGLVNVGRIDEAQQFLDLMPEKEAKPNVSSYEILLRAYVEAARLDDAVKTAKAILLDESVAFSDEMKELLEDALKSVGRVSDVAELYKDVEIEKAEAAARAAEEKARAEALAKEEEERKKAEAKAKEEATARASRAAIDAILGKKKAAEQSESSDSSSSGVTIRTETSDSNGAEEAEIVHPVPVDDGSKSGELGDGGKQVKGV